MILPCDRLDRIPVHTLSPSTPPEEDPFSASPSLSQSLIDKRYSEQVFLEKNHFIEKLHKVLGNFGNQIEIIFHIKSALKITVDPGS